MDIYVNQMLRLGKKDDIHGKRVVMINLVCIIGFCKSVLD